MESISLTSLASEKLAEAQQSHSGRAAHTIHVVTTTNFARP
jgi:hypothetical protein